MCQPSCSLVGSYLVIENSWPEFRNWQMNKLVKFFNGVMSWLTVKFFFFFIICRFFLVICRACPPYWHLSTWYSCVKTKISHSLLATAKIQVRKGHVFFFFYIYIYIFVHLFFHTFSLLVCKYRKNRSAIVSAFLTAGETLSAASADSVHMVPFQFDLMKLLPRCQQIELFFYTFSKGTATV